MRLFGYTRIALFGLSLELSAKLAPEVFRVKGQISP